MSDANIKTILLEEEASRHDLTGKILRRLPDTPVEAAKETEPGISIEEEYAMGKDTLHLVSYKGDFLKPCPGTKEYICCGYQILNFATNCPLNCSYCILQSYFNQPNLKVFVNLEENLEQILQTIDSNPETVFRIGTGEFTDSLALDPVTRVSDVLMPAFSERKN